MSLKIYPVVLELVRRLAPLVRVLRARSSVLSDQMERALISVPLNVAEGRVSSDPSTLSSLQLFHRVIGTLVRLIEPRC